MMPFVNKKYHTANVINCQGPVRDLAFWLEETHVRSEQAEWYSHKTKIAKNVFREEYG